MNTKGTIKRRAARRALSMVAAAALALGASACGDDGGGSKPPPAGTGLTAPGKAPAAPAAAKRAGAVVGLKIYTKVEEVVTPDEAEVIREPIAQKDYRPDPNGNDNRDPFRSFVVRQQNLTGGEAGRSGVTVAANDVCAETKMIAPNPRASDPRAQRAFSINDLKLQGVVLRGTRGYSTFRDPTGYGHLVHKGDCLGKEKAKVIEVNAHNVKVRIVPEPGPNQLNQEPIIRTFELYPDELPLDTETREEGEG